MDIGRRLWNNQIESEQIEGKYGEVKGAISSQR